MRTLLITLLLFTVSRANAAEEPILVSPQWLHEHLKDNNLVVLHVSFLQFDFDQEHIEGAQYLWPENLAPNSPQGSYNAPDVKKATDLLRSFGVNDNSHIVLYNVRNEVSPTARMFLTLENLGLQGRVSFLNGGFDAWKREGYAVTSVKKNAKTGNVTLHQGDRLVDKNYVLKTLDSNSGLVVDARAKQYYDGEPTGNPRDGHIKGAKNITYFDLVNDKNEFKSLDSLRGYFSPVASPDKELVTYCFIGQTASVVYMAGRMLGYQMKLYDGSMQEWSRIPSLPMEKTEAPK
ncbi:rhodanese-like domain-containing protein [Chryseolinea sp. T2]